MSITKISPETAERRIIRLDRVHQQLARYLLTTNKPEVKLNLSKRMKAIRWAITELCALYELKPDKHIKSLNDSRKLLGLDKKVESPKEPTWEGAPTITSTNTTG